MPLWQTFFDFYVWFLPYCCDHKGIEQGHLSLIESRLQVGSPRVANIQGKAEGNNRMPKVVFKLDVVSISWDIPLEEKQRVLYSNEGLLRNIRICHEVIEPHFPILFPPSECKNGIIKAVSQRRGGQQDGDDILTCWHGHRMWLLLSLKVALIL